MGVRAYRATLVSGPVGRVWIVDVGNDEVTDYGCDRLPPPPGRCGIEFMRMVSTMLGRRVGAGVVALALVCMISLSGCKQDNTPKEYNTLTQQNFLELCTNHYYDSTNSTIAQTGNTIKSGIDASSQDQCQCQYDVFVKQMPINKSAAQPGYTGTNFTDLNSKLKTDPEAAWSTVPESITNAVKACMSSSSSGTATAPSTTSTTAG